MFLFAKLVMENLYSQTSRAKLNKELEPDRFPRGLEEAYVIHFMRSIVGNCLLILSHYSVMHESLTVY